jgi:hypothetical protein
MKIPRAAVATAAIGGTALVVRRLVARRKPAAPESSRWRYVTINRPPQEVAPGGRLPSSLAALGDSVETVVRPAPGGRGTEVGARLVDGEPSGLRSVVKRIAGKDSRQDVRAALREAQILIETGEVLQPDRPGTTRSTLRGKPLELALQRAGSEGRS